MPPPPPPILPNQRYEITLNKSKETSPILKRSDSLKSNMTYVDEFKAMFPTLKLKKRTDLSIKITPDVFIDQHSTKDDIQNWLKKKEFDKDMRDKLKGFTAAELLLFSRKHCITVCGEEEGKRLFSQITLQKNSCHVSNKYIKFDN